MKAQMAKLLDIKIGDVYGKLTIIDTAEPHVYPNGTRRRQFLLSCDCGSAPFVANINNIRSGTTTSCGCSRLTHGMHKTRQYQCWADMKTRCDNEEHSCYKDYGGRGIRYPEKWRAFEGFWEDMREGYSDDLTINRVDNDASYSKENCIWDVQGNQNHMRRKRENTWLPVFGGIYDKRDGKMYARISYMGERLHLGWYVTEAEVAEAFDMASEILYKDRPNKTVATRDSVASKVRLLLSRCDISTDRRTL